MSIDPSELLTLDPSDPVVLTIQIAHDEPVQIGDLSALLESLGVLVLMTNPGGDSDSSYFDEVESRWRIRSRDDLLPTTPDILATDANFLITLATIAAVAGIVGGVSAVVSAVHDVKEGRRQKKANAKNAVQTSPVVSGTSGVSPGPIVQLAGDLAIFGNNNVINITIQTP